MQYLRAFVFSALFVLFLGCGDDPGPPGDEPDPDSDVVPASEVRVLDESARQSLTDFSFDLDANQATIRFDASNEFAENIEEGQILASRPAGEVAPSGLLQRVEAVERDGDAVVVTARQATLAETFERADFESTRDIDADDVETMQPLQPGVSVRALGDEAVRKQGLGKPFELGFDEVILDTDGDRDTTNDQLRLNGDITFGASFDTALKVRKFKLRRFLFAVNLDESVDLEMVGDFNEADIDKSKRVAEVGLTTITFQVGPVPVVIKIDLIVKMGIDGTLTAEVRASAKQSTDVRLGAEYTDDDGWNGINDTDSSFDVPPPEFSLSDANARGWVRPQIEIKLYGVAGPFVFAEPYVRFDAELYRSPYWQLYGGLEFGVGFVVTVPVLGEVASWEASFQAFEEPIGTSTNSAPTVEIVSPPDGSTVTAGQNLTLEIRAMDREQEAVTVRITGDGVDRETTILDGEADRVTVADLCQGVRNFRITAADDQGATTSVEFSAVVENATPTVTLDRSTLTGSGAPPIFPGGYLSAAAAVEDARCSDADPVNLDLVEWYLDGSRVARSNDLLTRLSPTEYSAGDTVSVQARFDDGTDVGESEVVDVALDPVPAGDLPVEVNITSCSVCDSAVNVGGTSYIPNEITVSGVAFDPKEGELSGDELVWELSHEDNPSDRMPLGTGETVTFKVSEMYRDPADAEGTSTIHLVVDDDGTTVSDTETFPVFIGG